MWDKSPCRTSRPGCIESEPNTLSGTFAAYTPQTLMTAFPVNPSLGIVLCDPVAHRSQSRGPAPGRVPECRPRPYHYRPERGSGGGPDRIRQVPRQCQSRRFVGGPYALTSSGGADVGALQNNFTVAAPGQWTNTSDYSTAPIATGQPVYVPLDRRRPQRFRQGSNYRVEYDSLDVHRLQCRGTTGSLTVPAYATRPPVQGGGTISMTFSGASTSFAGSGLDVGVVTSGTQRDPAGELPHAAATAPL